MMDGTGPIVKVKPRFSAPLKSFLKESGGERREREEQTSAGPSSKPSGNGNKKGKKRPVKDQGDDDWTKDNVKKRREEEEEVDDQEAAKDISTDAEPDEQQVDDQKQERKKGKDKTKKRIEEQESGNGNKKGKKRPVKEEGDDDWTKDNMKKRREEEEVDDQEVATDISTDAEPDDIMPREEEEERPIDIEAIEDSVDKSWVQCCKPECGKWRKLLPQTDPSELPRNWSCSMNIDPVYNSCLVSEEECDDSEDWVIMSNLVPGCLVWAQQRGYPWWPALIENEPSTHSFCQFKTEGDTQPSRYHLTYLGEPVSRAWVPKSKVKPYMDLTEHYVKMSASKGYQQKLKEAIVMATKAQKIPLVRRLDEFGFLPRQANQEVSDGESDISLGSLSTYDSDLQEAMESLVEKMKKSHYKKRPTKDKEEHKTGKREAKKRAEDTKPKKRSGKLKKKEKKVAKQAPSESIGGQEERDMEERDMETDPDQENEGGKETDFSSDSW